MLPQQRAPVRHLSFSSSAPTSAPASNASTAAVLRVEPLPVPPKGKDSAASAVSVSVSTVVVRSGTATRRTVALRIPIAEVAADSGVLHGVGAGGTFTEAVLVLVTIDLAGGTSDFGANGLFAGLSGLFLATTLHHPSHALSGATLFLVFSSGVAAQLATNGLAASRVLVLGTISMLIGLPLLVTAVRLSQEHRLERQESQSVRAADRPLDRQRRSRPATADRPQDQ